MNERPAPINGIAPDAVIWALVALAGVMALAWAGAFLGEPAGSGVLGSTGRRGGSTVTAA